MRDWRQLVGERLEILGIDLSRQADVVDELAQHVEDRFRNLTARGVSESEALASALRELDGNKRLALDVAQARVPATPPLPPPPVVSQGGLIALIDDLKFAWRRLLHAKAFAAVAILTLTLAVGANTAILSVADAVLFRPLPYANPEGLYIIQMLNRATGGRYASTPLASLEAIHVGAPEISEIAVVWNWGAVMSPTDDISLAYTTPNYFSTLGVTPARGRVFNETDTGSEGRVALLSHDAWQQRYGADESIVGGSVVVGSRTLFIVGVLPPRFQWPSRSAGNPAVIIMGEPFPGNSRTGLIDALVRVSPGVSRERAQAEVDTVTSGASRAVADAPVSTPVLVDVRSVLYPFGRPIMRYLLAASGLILLLACANLANLVLVRTRLDLRATAVRLALGATRGRLIRPILIESTLLGVVSAALAILLTTVLFDVLLRQVPSAAYGRAPVGLSGRVIAMSLGLGTFGPMLFSLIPAWRAAGVDLLPLIQRRIQGGRVIRLGRPLVAVQVAVALALVFGAAVSARAFKAILDVPLGFTPATIVRITVTLTGDNGITRQQQMHQILDALAARPDVVAAGAGGALPFSGQAPDEGVDVAGSPRRDAGIVHALPGYFEASGIPLIQGRLFTWNDVFTDSDVALVSVSAARALFGDRDPVGAVFGNGRGRQFRVLGVVGDIRHSLGANDWAQTYVIPKPELDGARTIIVRLRSRTDSALNEISDAVRVFQPFRMSAEWWNDRINAQQGYRNPRFQTMVLGGLAGLGLGLTALGIFSVVAYLVSVRTREMGVRLAVGASPESLVALMLRQSLFPVIVGVAAGGLLIVWGRRLAEAQSFQLNIQDPTMVLLAVGTVFVAAGLAAYLPARRALRINPADVLRAE